MPSLTDKLLGNDTSQQQINLAMQCLNNLLTGIIIIGNDQKIRWANKSVSKQTSYSPYELIGMDINQLLPEHFRSIHRQIIDQWFLSPKEISIEKRVDNQQKMKLLKRRERDYKNSGTPLTKEVASIDVLIGITPLYLWTNNEMIQTGAVEKPLLFGQAEITFLSNFDNLSNE